MNSDVVLSIKDSLKINILNELLGGQMKMALQIQGEDSKDYTSQIHKEQSRVQVFGKYNLSEDPAGEFITIRPVGPDCALTIRFSFVGEAGAKKVSLVRSATRTVDVEFTLGNESEIELLPNGKAGYLLKTDQATTSLGQTASAQVSSPAGDVNIIPDSSNQTQQPAVVAPAVPGEDLGSPDSRFASFSMPTSAAEQAGVGSFALDERFSGHPDSGSVVIGETSHAGKDDVPTPEAVVADHDTPMPHEAQELDRLGKEIEAVEHKAQELSQKKKSAIEHLEKIEAEYKKDYASLEGEIEDIRSRMEADASIIEYYKDRDITPIETLFQEISAKLEEAEAQIRLFIEARQKKTMDIEGEIKMNKKQ